MVFRKGCVLFWQQEQQPSILDSRMLTDDDIGLLDDIERSFGFLGAFPRDAVLISLNSG